MAYLNRLSWIAATFILIICAFSSARAADPPSDLCSLLTPAAVSKALGGTFGSPEKSVAPRPFANTAQGADCHYSSGGKKLWFRAYADSSPSESADLFAKLSKFYGTPKPVAGVGDEAYFDAKDDALHVRKGRVRYYLNLNPMSPAAEKQLTDLASQVAGQL